MSHHLNFIYYLTNTTKEEQEYVQNEHYQQQVTKNNTNGSLTNNTIPIIMEKSSNDFIDEDLYSNCVCSIGNE